MDGAALGYFEMFILKPLYDGCGFLKTITCRGIFGQKGIHVYFTSNK